MYVLLILLKFEFAFGILWDPFQIFSLNTTAIRFVRVVFNCADRRPRTSFQ